MNRHVEQSVLFAERRAALREQDDETVWSWALSAKEIAARHNYDPARMERHARLLDALDPACAEAVREYRLPGKVRAA